MNFHPLYRQDLEMMPEATRPTWCEDSRGIIAERNGEALAICVFDSWTWNSCMIHIWIGNPFVLKNGFAEEVFNYVFGMCDRNLIVGATPSDNKKALKFIKHIGFKELTRIKDGDRVGVDLVITEMRKESCRYYHGKEIARSA